MCGSNQNGELGTGFGNMSQLSPIKLDSDILKEKGIKKVLAGKSFCFVLTGIKEVFMRVFIYRYERVGLLGI